MKKKSIPAALKASLVVFACLVIFGFSAGVSSNPGRILSKSGLTEAQFHDNVANIINGAGLSQEELAQLMSEAEQRKSGSQTASNYIEDYMNTYFKPDPATMVSTNRVSIAAPGQSGLSQSVDCNLTALKTVTQNVVGYYYAFATKCDGTYKYDGKNYTGGSTVYVRAEASNYILEAFILF